MLGELLDRAQHVVTADQADQAAILEYRQAPALAARQIYDYVDEGTYVDGKWVFRRRWNGDQTDYGLNFSGIPQLLRVKLATY